jgi:hypothetical protein
MASAQFEIVDARSSTYQPRVPATVGSESLGRIITDHNGKVWRVRSICWLSPGKARVELVDP